MASKYVQFTIIYDEEKQQILKFMKLEPVNVLLFCLKNDTIYRLSDNC